MSDLGETGTEVLLCFWEFLVILLL